MARGNIYIPLEVHEAIKAHIERSVRKVLENYSSAAEDEDTFTGDLCGNLRSGTHSVPVEHSEVSGVWKWSISYYKFRGRGPQATESSLGADGIFELTLEGSNRTSTKSLLFQAKMGDSDREALLHQCIKLTTWREAAFVMVYSEEGFFACYLDDVIRARGNISDIRRKIPLDNFLSGQFMECHIGDLELRYSPPNRMLLWRSHDDEKIATKFSVRHRVRLKIQPPNNKTEDAYDRMIDPADIHKFRMMVDAEDMLGIGIERSPKLIRKVMRELSKTYHPDLFRTLRPDLRELVEMRMKEMNQAKDRLS